MPVSHLNSWVRRPAEVGSLLNPAFCSLLLRASAQGYSRNDSNYLPVSVGFLVLPIVLHKQTREAMPHTARSKLHVWIRENPIVRIGFSRRASELVPFTREALLFGLVHRSLRLTPDGALRAGDVGDGFNAANGTEARSCIAAATLLG